MAAELSLPLRFIMCRWSFAALSKAEVLAEEGHYVVLEPVGDGAGVRAVIHLKAVYDPKLSKMSCNLPARDMRAASRNRYRFSQEQNKLSGDKCCEPFILDL